MVTIIRNATELQAMNGDLTADYELGNDINASETAAWNGGAGFVPIGQGAPYFTGTFDGKGYTIKNLTINRNGTDFCGLFGVIDSTGAIQNVDIENITVHGEDFVGGLAGLTIGDETIENCHVIGGSVVGNDDIGGLVGWVSGDTLAAIRDCGATCSVTSDNAVAGNNNYIGGFAGYILDATIDDSYATGVVVGIGEIVGGFIGHNSNGVLNKCFSTGAVSTGNNGGESYCGGFAGHSNGEANDCYSTGSVTATGDYVGGFVATSAQETRCYATGAVTGVGAHVGGFCGQENTIENCFWDTDAGYATDPAVTGTTGKTTAEMKSVKTFQAAEWAISRIWNIIASCNSGYPCLIDVNECCAEKPAPVDMTIIGNKVSLEAIRNLEIVYGGRVYVGKTGNLVYESRYHRSFQ